MVSRLIWTAVFLFLCAGKSSAQDTLSFIPGIGIHGCFSNAVFPASSLLQPSDFTRGTALEFLFPVLNRLDLSIPFRLGTSAFTRNSARVWDRQVYFSTDIQGHLRYYPPGAGFNVYGVFGAGMVLKSFEIPVFQLPIGVGADLRWTGNLSFSTQAEFRKSFGQGTTNQFLVTVGIKFRGSQGRKHHHTLAKRGDDDGDGVPDVVDECPSRYGIAAFAGCPDSDSDGVSDARDACPDTPGPVAGCPDADRDGIPDKSDACPLEQGLVSLQGCPERDSDADGVPDHLDDCPGEKGIVLLRGCPDSDADGIRDQDDACPELAGVATTQGCPDTDNDGIEDRADHCPYSPGSALLQGCPELNQAERAFLDSLQYRLSFKQGAVVLDASATIMLDELVALLRRYPDFELMIRAHTDEYKATETNQRLSDARAKACYDYLIMKGIGPRRMQWAGLGDSSSDPHRLAPSTSGNRRIEFLLSPRKLD